jgi:four helix bundle protein
MALKTQSYHELKAWRASHSFVLNIYKATELFPKNEMFGLTSQFRRAAVSISANIAEGYRKKGKTEKLRFYNISQSSIEECDYYLIISKDLNYINAEKFKSLQQKLDLSRKLLNNYYVAISISR